MATTSATLILAHQGGWDEILFVLAPLLVFGGLLMVARRRAEQMDQDQSGPAHPSEDHEDAGPA